MKSREPKGIVIRLSIILLMLVLCALVFLFTWDMKDLEVSMGIGLMFFSILVAFIVILKEYISVTSQGAFRIKGESKYLFTLLSKILNENIMGDLLEEYYSIKAESSRLKANIWLLTQILFSVYPLINSAIRSRIATLLKIRG